MGTGSSASEMPLPRKLGVTCLVTDAVKSGEVMRHTARSLYDTHRDAIDTTVV
jgi:hypothetical protein